MTTDASKAAARDKLAALRNGFAARLRERVEELQWQDLYSIVIIS